MRLWCPKFKGEQLFYKKQNREQRICIPLYINFSRLKIKYDFQYYGLGKNDRQHESLVIVLTRR